MPIIDISLPLKKGAPVYPGNPALAITAVRGNSSTHSVIGPCRLLDCAGAKSAVM